VYAQEQLQHLPEIDIRSIDVVIIDKRRPPSRPPSSEKSLGRRRARGDDDAERLRMQPSAVRLHSCP
jgi:hypothetical protein